MTRTLGILIALALVCCAAGEDRRPRNVILVSVDTLRADRLGLYGYARPTSPFLDGLARAGVVFEDALTQAPWTLPAHVAMLTSLHPSQLDLGSAKQPHRLPDDVVTLAEVLSRAGYACAARVDGGYLVAQLGFDQGFERYIEKQIPADMAELVFRADEMVDGALGWLSERSDARPFFLFLHTYAAHDYNPPEAARERLVRPYSGGLTKIESGFNDLVQNPRYASVTRGLGPMDRRFVSDLYDAAVRSVDSQLERLYGELERQGLLDDTLLVITSDHGEELFDRGGTGHGYTLYSENLRVPLLLSHPSLAPRRVADTVRLLDVAPTLVDWLGLKPPSAWQGTSLLPLLEGETLSLTAFADSAHVPLQAVQSAGFKYIEGEAGSSPELYDRVRDPGERSNLAGEGRPEEGSLRRALTGFEQGVRERRQTGGSSAEVDGGLRRQLEALGYLDPGQDTRAGQP